MDLSTDISSTNTQPFFDGAYDQLVLDIKARVAAATGPLFTTDAANLWNLYLASFPLDVRQHFTCRTCKRFIETYGGLVQVDEKGQLTSLVWPTSGMFEDLALRVTSSAVTGVFLSSEAAWGQALTGAWEHLAAVPPAPFKPTVLTAFQVMAEKREDYDMLTRGLREFDAATVYKALALLSSEALYRSEKCEGVAKWLKGVHEARAAVRSLKAKQHVTWRAVATAPPGFCHVRSTMIGTLLEDIAADKPMAAITRSFAAKMNPLQYQRPTAPPKDGQIAQAEKVVAALQSAGALARRFARLEEIEAIWRPREAKPPKGGIFGHLANTPASPHPSGVTGSQDITFEKFTRTVLDSAVSIECLVPRTGAFYGLVTAANADAPPLLQWDREDRRNPVSWYTYESGSSASGWNLLGGQWAKVTAVTHLPFMWYGGSADHQGKGAIFVLAGCRDTLINKGAGFFPEQLKAEYHGVRAVMEAFARDAAIAGKAEATACGLAVRAGTSHAAITLRVTTQAGTVHVYRVDRWD